MKMGRPGGARESTESSEFVSLGGAEVASDSKEWAMASTHTSLHYHLVFSTKNRMAWLTDPIRERLHAFLGGCLRTHGGVALEIGGVDDHVHALAGLKPTHRLSDVLRDIKQASSAWLHELGLRDFAWQEGYGAFTVSPSAIQRVRSYIQNQEIHHEKQSFADEYRALLEKHGISFDERYLW
jgi:putative transposase